MAAALTYLSSLPLGRRHMAVTSARATLGRRDFFILSLIPPARRCALPGELIVWHFRHGR
jgi:hypothetical protein